MKNATNSLLQGDLSNYNKGTIALEKNKLDKALQFLKREKDVFKEIYLNLGNCYRKMGNSSEAWKWYALANTESVLDLDGNGGPMYAALGNMGLICYENGEDDQAEGYFKAALAMNPLHVMSIWNYSLVLLRRYCSGSELHQYAWKMHEYRFKAVRPIDKMPHWDRKSYEDKILVLSEQGMGDKIMYGRYLKLLAEKCGEVVVQCPVELDAVFSDYRCVRTVEESGCSVGIPIGCLAEIFGVVPGRWLSAEAKDLGPKFNIVVEWAGSKTHNNDKNRSCYAGYFSRLAKKLAGRGILLHNVRPDAPVVSGVVKHKTANWGESLAVIAGADLVVTVDTSLVHAAGSLGVDTLMMQPLCDTDFRWGNWKTKAANGIDPETNIWYDTVTVLENRDWEEMFVEIEARIMLKYYEWQKLQMLGGLTPVQFYEKYARTVDNNRRNNDTVSTIND